MAWQGTRKTNEQATITEGPVRSEAPGESGRERGASCGQVCEQSRKPETLTAILRPSALIMWSTGEPWRLWVRSSLSTHKTSGQGCY